jgi:tetratricopeptide (TPR) repeat protein
LAEFHYLGQGVGQDHALAEKYFKQAEEYSVSCRRLARYACGRSETAQAVAYLRRAIEISPTIGINYMVLAHVLEDSEEVVDLYSTVLALYVDDHVIQERVYVLLGKHQFKQNKWVEAFGYFQKCLEVNPGNHYAHMMAALTSANAETAHRHVDVILKAQPNDVAAVCMKGKIYLRENRLGEAEAMHVRARRLSASAVYTRELETELLVYENRLREAGPITRKRRLQK